MRSLGDAVRDMQELRRKLQTLENNLPRILGIEAVKQVRRNFREEGYEGQSWEKRKESTNKAYDKRGNYRGSVYNSSNPVLRQSGNYHDSVKYVVNGKMLSVGVNENQVPYAKAHNEGIGNLSKRQAIGYGNRMQRMLKEKSRFEYERVMSRFRR